MPKDEIYDDLLKEVKELTKENTKLAGKNDELSGAVIKLGEENLKLTKELDDLTKLGASFDELAENDPELQVNPKLNSALTDVLFKMISLKADYEAVKQTVSEMNLVVGCILHDHGDLSIREETFKKLTADGAEWGVLTRKDDETNLVHFCWTDNPKEFEELHGLIDESDGSKADEVMDRARTKGKEKEEEETK
jgi:hypothetical protein